MTALAPTQQDIECALPGIRVRTDPETLAAHGTDWTGRFRGSPVAVMYPTSTEEVVRAVMYCRDHGLPIVPQGGNTGLVGGAVATYGGVIVSTRRLDAPPRVDPDNWFVDVEAGVTLETLHEHVTASGARFGVDFAARGTATIGGAIATNAGGAHVIRHGPMRQQILGVEAVLPDGRVVRRLTGLRKDNTGLDLTGLLCGSEGTIGIITRAQLRILAPPRHVSTAMVGLDDLELVAAALRHVRRNLVALEAAELVLGDTMARVCAATGLQAPMPTTCPALLLLEVRSDHDPLERLLDTITGVPGLVDATADQGTAGSRRLWAYRERIPEVMSQISRTPVVKIDVAVPLSRLSGLVRRTTELVDTAGADAEVHLFGHAGDGNIHVNLVNVDEDDGDEIEAAVLDHVIAAGGAISAEHGIGTAKVAWLPQDRGTDDVSVMADLKRALDPGHLMNPGVLLDGGPTRRSEHT